MRVGVALKGMPNLLKDIVLSILTRQPGFVVIEVEENEGAQFVAAVEAHNLDVLVTALGEGKSSEAPTDLLYAHPHLRVLRLDPDGRAGVAFFLKPETTRFHGISPAQLVDAIRFASEPADGD